MWSLQDHGKCVISQLLILKNDTVINIHALIKANSCDNYEQDTQNDMQNEQFL